MNFVETKPLLILVNATYFVALVKKLREHFPMIDNPYVAIAANRRMYCSVCDMTRGVLVIEYIAITTDRDLTLTKHDSRKEPELKLCF